MINPEEQKAQAQQVINEIARHASKLYDLMEPGMVFDVTIPSKNDIIVPNQPQRIRRLLIVKPFMHIRLDSKEAQS